MSLALQRGEGGWRFAPLLEKEGGSPIPLPMSCTVLYHIVTLGKLLLLDVADQSSEYPKICPID